MSNLIVSTTTVFSRVPHDKCHCKFTASPHTQNRNPIHAKPKSPFPPKFSPWLRANKNSSFSFWAPNSRSFQIWPRSFTASEKRGDPVLEKRSLLEDGSGSGDGDGNGDGDGDGDGGGWDRTTSVFLFLLWGALMYYVFNLAPDQTPSRDMYFLQKLLNLKGDDGFRMNSVLVSLWYIMGLWPLLYSMLLLPTGRSSKSSILVWPFLVLSCFGGAYALIPYFVLWKPPPPPVEEAELSQWPLNLLESKLTAGILLLAGIGLVTYAAVAGGADWQEFYQYFRESKFIHVTCLDFTLLSAFAPFWVYNDMTFRKWYEKGSWLLTLSAVPFIGPALYLLLRPTAKPISIGSSAAEGR